MSLLRSCFDPKYLPSTFTLVVRWVTKPRWLPPAKTKKFRVVPRPQPKIAGEMEEIFRLYNIYRTNYKASIELFKEMYRESEVSQEVIDAQEKEKEDYWQEALKINEEWNRQVAIEREKTDRLHFEEEIRKTELIMKEKDEAKRKEEERLNALIREQEELAKTFITPEMLNEHVEKILNSPPHSFNFALDVQGNVYDDISSVSTRRITEEGEFSPLPAAKDANKKVARKRT